ncbi:MAG: hypothetical protein GY798_01065 [Hyphomicrobiales bacterium]|nr:hypothetical protein [Hyphomicrobiales bacterium]
MKPTEFRSGDIVSFKTRPFTKFSERPTGRYAAFKVLEIADGLISCTCLDKTWREQPTFEMASGLPALRNQRFAAKGRPAVFYVWQDWDFDLDEAKVLGNELPTDGEMKLLPELRGYGTWGAADAHAEGEWRWRNDREAVIIEYRKAEEERENKRKQQEAYYESRLKNLTFETLLSEQHFSRWVESPPFPPEAFLKAARETVTRTCHELANLGLKPKKRDVRKILKHCVEWFNWKDAEAGHVIETEEREDICGVLFELAFVAGHKSLADEIDEWRTW